MCAINYPNKQTNIATSKVHGMVAVKSIYYLVAYGIM
jgi:hypothetical protein